MKSTLFKDFIQLSVDFPGYIRPILCTVLFLNSSFRFHVPLFERTEGF
jgi:hypothetical protein